MGIYLLTYRGFPLSQDTYYIFDSVESFIRRGTFDLTYEFTGNFRIPADNGAPWLPSPQEPLNIVLVAPFYWLGSQLSGVGTVHVTWLFSLFMSAFVGVNLFWGALWLRYPLKVAWWGALIFGVSTLTWTYSRFLFREPITTFFVLWCSISAIYVHREWRQNKFPIKGLLVFIIAFAGTFLSKEISITLLPGLLLIILPPLKRFRWRVILPRLIVLGVVVGLFIVFVLSVDQSSTRYSFDSWLRRLNSFNLSIFFESILGYQISLSRSFWLHSPILLVGLLSTRQLLKRGEWQIVAGAWLMLIVLSGAYVGYSIGWWGNWGWGPRYMLPLIPIFMIGVFEVMTHQIQTRTHKILFAGVVILGVAMQVIGMATQLPNYYTDMFFLGILPELREQPQWGAYNWQWEYSPLNYHLKHFNLATMDIAWVYTQHTALIVGAISAFILINVGYVWLVFKHTLSSRNTIISIIVMSVVMVGVMAGAMVSLRDDERYTEEWHDVRQLIEQLNDRVTKDQIVFVDRQQYQLNFMNYFKAPAIVAILPYAPGENYNGQPTIISPTNIEASIGRSTYYALNWSARTLHQIWLIASSSPFEETKTRPVERYLTEQFYPIEEIATSDRARAIRYLMLDREQIDKRQPSDVIFDNKLQIQSFNLPLGQTFRSGDVLPITLDWSPFEKLDNDYNISVRLVASDGYVLAQHDGLPMWTFGKMSTWEVDQIYHDNHGIQIPQGAIAGEYSIYIIVYRWQDGARLPVTSIDSVNEEAFLTTITIE
jgi:hypothetical protein